MSELVRKIDEMNEVVRLLVRGKDATAISRDLGISRASVINRIEEWREYVAGSHDIQARAKQTLAETDVHYNEIISEFWNVYNEAQLQNDPKTQNAILKNLATTEAERVKLYAAAGLTSDNELAAQLMETERKQELLMKILREVTKDCPRCNAQVRQRLSDVTKNVEVIEVHEQ